MSLSYDTTILDHLAEYFLYLAAAPSFWFSINSSYDHEFHLSHRLGMTPYDYECIMVAAKLAEFNKTRGFFISLSRLEAFLAGHWFATCNSTVTFEVDTKKIDIDAYINGVSVERRVTSHFIRIGVLAPHSPRKIAEHMLYLLMAIIVYNNDSF